MLPKKVVLLIVLLIGLPEISSAKLSTWAVGTERRPWLQWAETMTAWDDTSSPGAIQLREFQPDENIVTSLFTGEMFVDWSPRAPAYSFRYEEGMPCVWIGTAGRAAEPGWQVADGDWNTTFAQYLVPFVVTIGSFYTIDLGALVPANRFVFGPAQEGLDASGKPRRENYMRGYKFSAGKEKPEWLDLEPTGLYPPGTKWHQLRHFKELLIQNGENAESVVTLEFPTQYLRYFRIQNIVEARYEIAEMRVYGEGFASKASYTSNVIDLQQIANFGRLYWTAMKWRKNQQGILEPAPDAKISISVETRSGKDDTPLVYHMYTKTSRLKIVDEETWWSLPWRWPWEPIKPYTQGPVTHDGENWSHWSVPSHLTPGEQIKSPGPRRYFQFRLTAQTQDFREMVRIDSLWFELSSPPLAEEMLGEVALLHESDPSEGTATVIAGEPATFTYDVRADFTSPLQAGFDSLQIDLPSHALFDSLQVGNKDTLITIACKDSILEPSVYKDLITGEKIYIDTSSPEKIVLYFPSQPIAYGSWDRLRLVFSTSVLVYGTQFTGKAWKSGTDNLPEPIQPGDANSQVTTNKLRVSVQEKSLGTVLDAVEVLPKTITPNNDGVNDEARFSYALFQITGQVQVKITIYDLSGSIIKTVYEGSQPKGVYKDENGIYSCGVWKGEDQQDNLVPPGLYIWRISVETDRDTFDKLGTISVTY